MRDVFRALCVTVCAAAAVWPLAAAAQSLGPLVKVAGGDPFTLCTADQVMPQSGTNFGGTAVEPWIAVDPTQTGHLLTGVQQDRWSTGGSRGLRASVSNDGGLHWKSSFPRGISQCQGGLLQRSTDPWTAFGRDGTAYFFSLVFDDADLLNGAMVNRSLDGGQTWQPPVTLIFDTDPLAFNDKNSITADPVISGNAYAVWDRLYGPASAFQAPGGSDERTGGAAAAQAVTHDGMQRARNHRARMLNNTIHGATDVVETFGPAYFSRTTDSGQSWSRAVPIFDPGPNAQTIGNLILVQPSGELLDFFTQINADGTASISFVRSQDHGLYWTAQSEMAVPLYGWGPVTPDSEQWIRSEDIIFSVTNDPATGTLYAVLQDLPDSPDAQVSVVMVTSLDDGKTWSAPIPVNQTPVNTVNPLRGQAFNPAVAVSGNGTVVVTYYDFRNDTGIGGEWTDVWAVFCNPSAPGGCATPANWGRELRLSPKSFDITQAPVTTSGFFLGDYFGLVAQGTDVYAANPGVSGPGQTALYSRVIHTAP